jgi:hypothetical protein
LRQIDQRGSHSAVASGDSRALVNSPFIFYYASRLTDEQTAALLRELDHIIGSERYFLSPRIRTLKAPLLIMENRDFDACRAHPFC